MINYKVIHQSMVYHLVLGLIFRVAESKYKKEDGLWVVLCHS